MKLTINCDQKGSGRLNIVCPQCVLDARDPGFPCLVPWFPAAASFVGKLIGIRACHMSKPSDSLLLNAMIEWYSYNQLSDLAISDNQPQISPLVKEISVLFHREAVEDFFNQAAPPADGTAPHRTTINHRPESIIVEVGTSPTCQWTSGRFLHLTLLLVWSYLTQCIYWNVWWKCAILSSTVLLL